MEDKTEDPKTSPTTSIKQGPAVICMANSITDDYTIFRSYPRFLVLRPYHRNPVVAGKAVEVSKISSFPECSHFPHEFNTGNNKFLLFCFLYKIRHFIGITSSIFIVAEHDTSTHTGVMYLAALIGPLQTKSNSKTMEHYLQELIKTYGPECFEEYVRPTGQIEKDLEIPDHWHLRYWDFHEGFLEGLVSLNNQHLPQPTKKKMIEEIIASKELNERVVTEQAAISSAHKKAATEKAKAKASRNLLYEKNVKASCRLPDIYRQFRSDLETAKSRITQPVPVVCQKVDETLATLQDHFIQDITQKVEELKNNPLVVALLRDAKRPRTDKNNKSDKSDNNE